MLPKHQRSKGSVNLTGLRAAFSRTPAARGAFLWATSVFSQLPGFLESYTANVGLYFQERICAEKFKVSASPIKLEADLAQCWLRSRISDVSAWCRVADLSQMASLVATGRSYLDLELEISLLFCFVLFRF